MLALFPILLVQLSSLGFPQAIANQLARTHSISVFLIRDIYYIIIIQFAVTVIFHAVTISYYVNGKTEEILHAAIISLIAIPGHLLSNYGLAGLQGLQEYRLFNTLKLLVPAGWVLAVLILFLMGEVSIFAMLSAWCGIQLIAGSAIFSIFLRCMLRKPALEKEKNYDLKNLFRFGLRGMIGHIEPIQSFHLDQLILGLYFVPEILGIYAVAKAFSNLPVFISQHIGFIAFPIIASRQQENISLKIIFRFLLILNAVLIPAVYLLILFMQELVSMLFGDAFSGAVEPARVLVLSTFLGGLRKVMVEALRGFGFPQASTYAEFFSYPVALGVGIYIVPDYGALGMATTLMATNMTGLAIVIIFLVFNIRSKNH